MAVAQFAVRPTLEPPLAGGSTFCAVIATVHLSRVPNTYGCTQIDYELVTFNLVKRLMTIGNFKVRAEKGGNGRTASHREMHPYTKKTPGSKTRG